MIATTDWLDEAAIAARRGRQRAAGPVAQRRIVLHLGPHKTGSAFIQRMAEHNLPHLPPEIEVIERVNPDLLGLRGLTKGLRSLAEAERRVGEITDAATRLERHARDAACTLVSHEALLGATPGTHGIRGLYPFAGVILPALLAGLSSGGAEVQPVVYARDFDDWLRSNDTFRRQKSLGRWRLILNRRFDPASYAARHDLPRGWDDLHARLRAASGRRGLAVLSFEAERDAGLIGAGLYRLMGLDDAAIARLDRIAPQNVTTPSGSVQLPQA